MSKIVSRFRLEVKTALPDSYKKSNPAAAAGHNLAQTLKRAYPA
jgi:hypothetical protein